MGKTNSRRDDSRKLSFDETHDDKRTNSDNGKTNCIGDDALIPKNGLRVLCPRCAKPHFLFEVAGRPEALWFDCEGMVFLASVDGRWLVRGAATKVGK